PAGRAWARPLADNRTFVEVSLPADALARLDQASCVTAGFPRDLLARAGFIFGGLSGQLVLGACLVRCLASGVACSRELHAKIRRVRSSASACGATEVPSWTGAGQR